MYTFLLSEFIRLLKFELERELPQTTNQSKVVNLVSRLWYRISTEPGLNPPSVDEVTGTEVMGCMARLPVGNVAVVKRHGM